MLAKIFVTYKKDVLDPQGKTVKEALGQLGFDSVGGVRQGKYFEIELKSSDTEKNRSDIKLMCERLLANPVIEDYRFELREK